jgi:hypothetical protein
MVQGDKKTGQMGTNAIFAITHTKITHALAAKKFSPLQAQFWTTAHKKMTHITFA